MNIVHDHWFQSLKSFNVLKQYTEKCNETNQVWFLHCASHGSVSLASLHSYVWSYLLPWLNTWSCSTPATAVRASLGHFKLVLNNGLPIFLGSLNLKSPWLEIHNTKYVLHKKIWVDTHSLLSSLWRELRKMHSTLSVPKCFLSNFDSATILQWQTLGMTFFDTMSIVTSVTFDTRHIGVIWHRQLDSSGHWRSNA